MTSVRQRTGRRGPQGLPAHLAGAREPLVFGVLNVTPDSFSDGGQFATTEAAVEQALRLVADGASVVDVGGESTRPGAARVGPAQERARVLPVVRELANAGVAVSIDTMRAEVAAAALEAGAGLVNDVSGGLADPDMARVIAGCDVPYAVMHWRGHSADMAGRAVYADVVTEVVRELGQRVDALVGAGVSADRLVLDPGLGFAKQPDHNWTLLRRLDELAAMGLPLLVGGSRKRFLGELLADHDGVPRPPDDRDVATAALSALLANGGVWAVRVHDVRATADALRVADALGGPFVSERPQRLDRIALTGLRVHGFHGVYDEERRTGQPFVVDLVLELDLAPAAASDDVADTVHYGELAERVATIVAGEPVSLLETLAARVADEVLADRRVRALEVTVHKPQAPVPVEFADVSVTLRRGR